MFSFKNMADSMAISENLWLKSFVEVEKQFEIENLLPDQQRAIKAFFSGKNVFVNLPTGYGKSLIFQCLPIVADAIQCKPRGSNVLVVISPLKALMEDQVTYLNNMCIPAVAIKDDEDPEIIQQVINGTYILVFGSPECFLSSPTWRGIFTSPSFRELLVGVAIDEAHCITQWGLQGAKKGPFRKWYGCLGELGSLIPEDAHLLILTATATKDTKKQILETLNLSPADVEVIEQSPDRPNLFYSCRYMDKNEPLEKEFGAVIEEIKASGSNTPRTLIYCQTRKQCSLLFRMFEVYLGNSLYKGSLSQPRNRLVEMYHAGTPQKVKDHVSKNMATVDGHLRVLIATVAVGMGVNCRSVRRAIHFGPSKTVELYIQECGRAGRDGLPSTCVLLYNGLLSTHCDAEIKKYLTFQDEGQCSRKWLMSHFGCVGAPRSVGHEYCGSCLKICRCNTEQCGVSWSPHNSTDQDYLLLSDDSKHQAKFSRAVSPQQKRQPGVELRQLQKELLNHVKVDTMVNCPNVILEFNSFQIKQVLEQCNHLFTLEDVFHFVEIWRKSYAFAILGVLNNVFNDLNPYTFQALEYSADQSAFSDWSQVREDPTLMDMLQLDHQDLEEFPLETEEDSSQNSISF